MELFRSGDMKYLSITMTNESSHSTIRELGRLGKFHPIDLSLGESKAGPSKQLTHYKKRVQDCVFWEKKLEFFKQQMINNGWVTFASFNYLILYILAIIYDTNLLYLVLILFCCRNSYG